MSSALAAPTSETTHLHPATQAMIICSALAWKSNPLAGLDIHTNHAQRLVDATCLQHNNHEILNWRTHTDPGIWEFRWVCARRATRQHFPSAVGLDALPHTHEDLPRM